MTPETEALIARVNMLPHAFTCASKDYVGGPIHSHCDCWRRDIQQLATALEAESKRAEFWKTALDAEYARRIDKENKIEVLATALSKFKTMYPNSPHIVAIVDTALTQLEP